MKTVIWLIFVIACVFIVIIIQIYTIGKCDWFPRSMQIIVILKMIGGTKLYQESK